jgi:hypothetical protein
LNTADFPVTTRPNSYRSCGKSNKIEAKLLMSPRYVFVKSSVTEA